MRGLARAPRRTRARALLAAGLLGGTGGVATGCGLLFPPSPGGPPATDPSAPGTEVLEVAGEDLPVGRGTLRQEEISIAFRRGEVQVRVTPLDESVIRVTAPDTYERLTALARGHQEVLLRSTGSAVPFALFLVSMYSEAVDSTFEPEALNLVSLGLRYRPVEVRPVTPEWETRRLRPREALLAVYAFPAGVDLGPDLEVEYEEVRSREWARLLPVIEAERARVRARR